MLPLVLAATSKVPWYFGGGILAVYAVVLAAIGIKRPNFPNGAAGARGVMALSAVLVAIAIATAIITA